MVRIDKAFQAINRADFLPDEIKHRAEFDTPIPIGYGQTNSQPSTVQMMLEWLNPQLGDRVLDVGSGSGWTTALLAYLVGSDGVVFAVEKVPQLVTFGARNVSRAEIHNAHFYQARKTYGLPEHAPYDKILVGAAASELPEELLNQLKPGGMLVIPIGNSVHVIDKTDDKNYESAEHPGFAFVPLVKE